MRPSASDEALSEYGADAPASRSATVADASAPGTGGVLVTSCSADSALLRASPLVMGPRALHRRTVAPASRFGPVFVSVPESVTSLGTRTVAGSRPVIVRSALVPSADAGAAPAPSSPATRASSTASATGQDGRARRVCADAAECTRSS